MRPCPVELNCSARAEVVIVADRVEGERAEAREDRETERETVCTVLDAIGPFWTCIARV